MKDVSHIDRWALPIVTLALALFLLLAFQVQQVLRDRATLKSVYTNQEEGLKQLDQLQAGLDRLAIGTQKLAADGNVNAKALVGQLEQMGITINPNAGQTVPAP